MAVVIGILALAAAVLLSLLLFHRSEMKHISRQIREIVDQDTNELVHTVGAGGADRELIDAVNGVLEKMRREGIAYRKKRHDLEMMITNISHDLRTPLTSAMGYVGLLREREISREEQARELAIVEQRLLRLEELINSFFEFSKSITGDHKPEMEPLNLTALLEEAIAHYYDDYCERGRRILFEKDGAKCMVSSNRNMLMRVFENLIGNGLKHGKGSLFVNLSSSDGIRIRFSNAVGEENMDVTHIFDEFYITDISRSRGNTGLGLAIARQFTHLLGGRISARSHDGMFTVTVELPAGESVMECGRNP